jgi:multidrug efflux system membrane fusion protein
MMAKIPRTRRRLWIAGTTLTALTAVATAMFSMKTNSAQPPAAPAATPVSVATVVPSDVATWDEFSGRLEAVERVDIRSRVAGTVQAVHSMKARSSRKATC